MTRVKILNADAIEGGFLLTDGKEYEVLDNDGIEALITHNMYDNIRTPFALSEDDFKYVEFVNQ